MRCLSHLARVRGQDFVRELGVRVHPLHVVQLFELVEELAGANPPVLIDNRSPTEFASGHIEGAVNIPVDELRERTAEVPAGRPVVVYCGVGYRAYLASVVRQGIDPAKGNVLTPPDGVMLDDTFGWPGLV